MIGGNIEAVLQQKNESATNAIGEKTHTWVDICSIRGWLDFSSGDSKYTNDAKLQETTHIFICDYVAIDRNAENKRLKVNGNIYDVLFVDDPMELHQHLEFNLKFLGAVT